MKKNMCFPCWIYSVTESSQLDENAAQLLDYSGRGILPGVGDLETWQLIVQLLHSGLIIESLFGLECHNSTATVADFRCFHRGVRLYDLSDKTIITFTAVSRSLPFFSSKRRLSFANCALCT